MAFVLPRGGVTKALRRPAYLADICSILALYLAYILAFYLAYILALYLACILAFYLATFWHSIWHVF